MRAVDSPIAVVLMNMGGPDSLEAVEPFLYNLFRDHDLIPLPLGFLWQRRFARMVSRARARTVREYYKLIGGRSPIGDITAEQANKLEERLNARADGGALLVPRGHALHAAVHQGRGARRCARDGRAHHRRRCRSIRTTTTATTGSSLWELRRELAGKPPAPARSIWSRSIAGPIIPRISTRSATQVRRGLEQFPEAARAGVELLFSAHGLPETFI